MSFALVEELSEHYAVYILRLILLQITYMLHIMHLYAQLTRLDDKYCHFRETHRWKSRKC